MATLNINTAFRLESLLAALEKKTGKSFDAESFESRFLIQKTVYLLKALGHPVAGKYDFNLYLRGPYSTCLAREYYASKDAGRLRELSKRPPTMVLGGEESRVVCEAVERGEGFLEAVATLHSLATRGLNRNLPPEKLFEHAKAIKPHLVKYFRDAWAFLEREDLISGYT